jgi:hypothetical protein
MIRDLAQARGTSVDWYLSLSIIDQFHVIGATAFSAFTLLAMVRDYLHARRQG